MWCLARIEDRLAWAGETRAERRDILGRAIARVEAINHESQC